MAYVKINWTESTPRSADNLDHMETQYERSFAGFAVQRANGNEPLRVEVQNTFPAHAQGKVFAHTANNLVYFSTGSAWRVMFKPGDVGV